MILDFFKNNKNKKLNMQLDFLSNPINVLAIDDSKLNRAFIIKTLNTLNINVDEANDGLEGLKALKKKTYDLILVDIVMPNLDGFGFLEKFQSFIGNDFIPVILMTGLDDLNSKIKGLRIGADDFLLKPLNEKELVARVFSLLRLKNVHTQLYHKNIQIQKELETAKKIQECIIPKNFDHINYPKISGRYLPIEDIGGDYFDCYKLKENKIGFLIADVTGHGIPAALIMTMSKMTFSIYAPQFTDTKELLKKINTELINLLLTHQYITCFYVIYDPNSKIIHYTNAGHTRALYYKNNQDKIIGLDTHGLFIGISEKSQYETKTIKIQPGDRLFLYTDGITELMDEHKDGYGENRLAKFIKNNKKFHDDAFCEELLKDLNNFSKLENRKDDIAFINIEF